MLTLVFVIGLGVCASADDGTPTSAALVGTWRIDLRPTPDADAYFQEFVISEVDGTSFQGTFYGSEVTQGRINADWGAIHFAFVTSDGSGQYNTSGVFDGRTIRGTTHSLGRGFISVWSGERVPAKEQAN